jgi:hypothetical protein
VFLNVFIALIKKNLIREVNKRTLEMPKLDHVRRRTKHRLSTVHTRYKPFSIYLSRCRSNGLISTNKGLKVHTVHFTTDSKILIRIFSFIL